MIETSENSPESQFEKNVALARICRDEKAYPEAIALFRKALDACPGHPQACFELGDAYFETLQLEDAIRCYKLAYNNEKTNFLFLRKLGETLAFYSVLYSGKDGSDLEALFFLNKVLAIDPHFDLANQFFGEYHQLHGRPAAARAFFNKISKPQAIDEVIAKHEKRKVLIIQSSGAGNLVFSTILAKETNTRLLFSIEYTTDAQLQRLPGFDVAFNVIGNPDFLDDEIIRKFDDFQRITGRKFLNNVRSVMKTRRDRAAALFYGIENIIVPWTIRMTDREILDLQSSRDFSKHGLSFPLIVRPIGGHGGKDVKLMVSADSFSDYQIEGAEAFYLINFVDYKSSDGYYRKYRTLFVNGKLYHYHLAISSNWLVHYFSADMLGASFKRSEEKEFLEQPEKVLGKAVIASLQDIAARLDLDYCGIDYAIAPDGRVIVFEANTQISVYPVDPDQFSYKVKYVNAIFEAVEDMLARKSGA